MCRPRSLTWMCNCLPSLPFKIVTPFYGKNTKTIATKWTHNIHVLTSTHFNISMFHRIFDRDGNGTLDRDELKRCLTSLGEQLTDQEVDELFDQLDTDRSGTLSVMGKKVLY